MRTIVLGALALAVLPLSGTPSPAAPAEPEVSGAEAVVAAAARRGTVRLIARLARPADGAPLTPALATRRAADPRDRDAGGGIMTYKINSIRGLPLAVLEARPAQLAALSRCPAWSRRSRRTWRCRPGWRRRPRWSTRRAPGGRRQRQRLGGRGPRHRRGRDPPVPYRPGRRRGLLLLHHLGLDQRLPERPGEQVGAGAGANCPATVAGCEHGTYVAGIAAGRDYTGGPGLNGVAPDAGIVPVQVFSRFEGQSCTNYHLTSPCALTWTSDQIKGLQQVAAFAATTKIAAVNMSLVSGLYLSSCDSDLRKPAIDALAALGSPPSWRPAHSSHIGVGAPACISSAVAVGASTTTTPEALAPFTDDGPMVALLAPGVSITSSVPGKGWATADGTSAAAPHVAGAIADLRSKLPDVPAAQIVQALEATGKPITDAVNSITKPRIDVYDALASLNGAPTWQPWASRGGTLGSFPDCSLTGTRIDCFARSAVGTLLWSHSDDGDSWASWADLAGTLGGPPACLVRGSRIDCFATTPAHHLAQISYDGTAWSAWADRGGAVQDRPSCVAGQARRSTASPGAPTRRFTGSPSTARSGRPGRRSAGRWRRGRSASPSRAGSTASPSTPRRTCSSGGSPRASGAAGPSSRPAAALAPACAATDTSLLCITQSATNGLLKGSTNGTRWTAWTDLGGSSVATSPYCNRPSTGPDCYWVSQSHQLVNRRSIAAAWGAEQALGGAVQGRPVCLMRNDGARIDCLARGLDNTLQQLTYR